MFINALTFNVESLKKVSDKELVELKEYFYRTQVQMMNIHQEIKKDIKSHEWRKNLNFINILEGLDGTDGISARKNKYLPMFGVAGDRKDYLHLWHLAKIEEERREKEKKATAFNTSEYVHTE